MDNIISVKNLKKEYEDGRIKALNGIDLEINKGEFVAIIGKSGSGKSTLLNMLGALDIPDEGEITVFGENINKGKNLSEFRSYNVGFIFQLHNLIPTLTAVENIEIPLYWKKVNSKEMRKKALYLLEKMDLEDRANIEPPRLSGGERQRVAIARSLINNPQIILADEPTGSLDSENEENIMELLKKLHKEENITLIIITHEQNIADMADRVIKLKDGKVTI